MTNISQADEESRKVSEAIGSLELILKNPSRRRLQELIAKTKKAELDHYVQAGFTREEAMQIITGESP